MKLSIKLNEETIIQNLDYIPFLMWDKPATRINLMVNYLVFQINCLDEWKENWFKDWLKQNVTIPYINVYSDSLQPKNPF
jgi:hypothetical protein